MPAESKRFINGQPIKSEAQPKTHLEVILEGGEFYSGFDVTRQFLKRATKEEAHLAPSRGRRVNPKLWLRDVEITRAYIETPKTLEDVGRSFNLTRQGVHQVVLRSVRKLWANCSAETKRLFPLSSLPLDKSQEESARRQKGERMSWYHEGKAARIAKMVEEGRSIREIKQELGISTEKLGEYRQSLKKWGIEIPYITIPYQNRYNKMV